MILSEVITEIHIRSRGTYGHKRTKATLEIEMGLILNKKLVSKLMSELHIVDLPLHNRAKRNLVNVATHEDFLKRDFRVDGPNVSG